MVETLPMFPLESVLFPGATLPLHVFEPRYRTLVRELLERDEDAREFGVVLIERGSEVGGHDVRFHVGTRARVVQTRELDDGRYALLAVGVERLRVVEWLPDSPFPRASVERWPGSIGDPTGSRERVERALRSILTVVRSARALDGPDPGGAGDLEALTLSVDPAAASWQAAALAPLGPLDAQRLLEAESAADRLEGLERSLTETLDLLRRDTGGSAQ